MVGGRQPLLENDLQRKTTFIGRLSLVEDDLRWKTTFGGRRPFVGRQPLVEDDLWWKMTVGERQHLVEDDLHWILAFCLLRFAAVLVSALKSNIIPYRRMEFSVVGSRSPL